MDREPLGAVRMSASYAACMGSCSEVRLARTGGFTRGHAYGGAVALALVMTLVAPAASWAGARHGLRPSTPTITLTAAYEAYGLVQNSIGLDHRALTALGKSPGAPLKEAQRAESLLGRAQRLLQRFSINGARPLVPLQAAERSLAASIAGLQASSNAGDKEASSQVEAAERAGLSAALRSQSRILTTMVHGVQASIPPYISEPLCQISDWGTGVAKGAFSYDVGVQCSPGSETRFESDTPVGIGTLVTEVIQVSRVGLITPSSAAFFIASPSSSPSGTCSANGATITCSFPFAAGKDEASWLSNALSPTVPSPGTIVSEPACTIEESVNVYYQGYAGLPLTATQNIADQSC